LARHLGPDQPFYGLQAVGLDGESEPHTQVKDMAAHYIESLRAVQPHGPFVLGGHSIGGVVAFEMAQQLQRKGEQVARVIVFDAPPVIDIDPALLEWDDAQWLVSMARQAGRLSGKEQKVSYEILQSLEPDEQLRYFGEQLQAGGWLPPGEIELTQLYGQVRVFQAQNSVRYMPQDVRPTHITLFRASERVPVKEDVAPRKTPEDRTLGWSEFVGDGVEVIEAPGDHLTMMTGPRVQVLAERLRSCLKKKKVRETQVVPNRRAFDERCLGI